MNNFILSGIAGFVAPRHLKAIKETNNELIAAFDPHDAVGVLDSYFPEADFFTEFERFDRYIDKLQNSRSQQIDYLSICSPNYLHDAQIRYGLRMGCNVICEKPLVLNPWNLDAIARAEEKSEKKLNCILQLRHLESVKQLKSELDELHKRQNFEKKHEVELTYITSRGRWYQRSWKSDIEKSGGLITNIGIHFFDLFFHLFGKQIYSELHLSKSDKASGFIELEKANVRWYLSIDNNDISHVEDNLFSGGKTFRKLSVNGKALDLSNKFTELHTISYENILLGKGFNIEECRPSVELTNQLRQAAVVNSPQNPHDLMMQIAGK